MDSLGCKEGGPFRWKHPRAQLSLGKKVLKKKEKNIGREEGLQATSGLFIFFFSYSFLFLWLYVSLS